MMRCHCNGKPAKVIGDTTDTKTDERWITYRCEFCGAMTMIHKVGPKYKKKNEKT